MRARDQPRHQHHAHYLDSYRARRALLKMWRHTFVSLAHANDLDGWMVACPSKFALLAVVSVENRVSHVQTHALAVNFIIYISTM